MSYTLKEGMKIGLALSAVYLSGFITCMTTPFVDKLNIAVAWEQKSTVYLTSPEEKMRLNAMSGAVDRCRSMLPDGQNSTVLHSQQAYLFCQSKQYARYATQLQTASAAYLYASCQKGLHTEKVCMEAAGKVLPAPTLNTVPLPLPFE